MGKQQRKIDPSIPKAPNSERADAKEDRHDSEAIDPAIPKAPQSERGNERDISNK